MNEKTTIRPLYQKINDQIKLKDIKTLDFFKSHNDMRCWHEGLDENTIKLPSLNEKCICKQGWHGPDCGQPEVVWRAIMASKEKIQLNLRKTMRRIIYTFNIQNYNSAIVEAIIEELYKVVDLFVICDFSNAEDNYRHKLDKGILPSQQNKILYINLSKKLHKPTRIIEAYVWNKITDVVKNIKEDDIYITTDAEEIINWRALMFLKIYNGWPEPIAFRLRYSVFGFFWQHSTKTKINIGACTVRMIYDNYKKNSTITQRGFNERNKIGLIIGDLNHYGGWYCQYCQSPANILIAIKQDTSLINKKKYAKNIDVLFIEDLIRTGIFLDGKTSLLRAYKSRDNYFAPDTVLKNNSKYDWLVENFYAKLDYY